MGEEKVQVEIGYKIWLKGIGDSFPGFSLGPGDVQLMEALMKHKNLTKASEAVGYSYKYAWRKLKDIKKQTGIAVSKSFKGGAGGGGKVILTNWGRYLVSKFNEFYQEIEKKVEFCNEKLSQNPFVRKNSD